MTTPVLVPPTQAELAVPYLTPAGFAAYPTWLDLDNLVPGGVAALQTDELAEALLAASAWAIGVVDEMPLHAHWVQGEQQRIRSGAGGRVAIKPRHIPVRSITSLSWGSDPTSMQADSLPDPTMWFEDGRQVSFCPGGGLLTAFTGTVLEFGPQLRPSRLTYIDWSYVAGYPNTTLAASCLASAASVEVADPTGILPGDVLRIYDAGDTSASVGASEALTVASTYAPALPTIPPVATSIPLAGTTQFPHAAGIGITGFPRKIIQAVIAYTVALLMRDDTSAERPATGFGPTASTRGPQVAGTQPGALVAEATGWLRPYAPVWRS